MVKKIVKNVAHMSLAMLLFVACEQKSAENNEMTFEVETPSLNIDISNPNAPDSVVDMISSVLIYMFNEVVPSSATWQVDTITLTTEVGDVFETLMVSADEDGSLIAKTEDGEKVSLVKISKKSMR